MARDDFRRVYYTKVVEGRKKRTSVSVDPDLFEIFSMICGGSIAADALLKTWAMEIENDREAATFDGIGASRLVVRRILAEVKSLVKDGMMSAHQRKDIERGQKL
jgi:hypothetical protein